MINNGPARIFIVDDHSLVRAGLRQLIGDEPDLVVCGEAATMHEAQRMLEELSPDLSIIDISLPDNSGIDLIKRVHSNDPDARILVASMHDESLFAERALRAGAMGYINKQEAAGKVIDAIRQILKGKIYLSPTMTERFLRNMSHKRPESSESPIASLSDRELQIFELIGRGLKTGQIAEQLHLSVKTIETHRANIKKKLNLDSGNELVMCAMQWSLEQH